MRISDWSSDVCTSDLTGVDAARVQQPREAVGAGIEGGIVHDSLAITNRDPRWRSIDLRLDQRVNWRLARVRHGRLIPQCQHRTLRLWQQWEFAEQCIWLCQSVIQESLEALAPDA